MLGSLFPKFEEYVVHSNEFWKFMIIFEFLNRLGCCFMEINECMIQLFGIVFMYDTEKWYHDKFRCTRKEELALRMGCYKSMRIKRELKREDSYWGFKLPEIRTLSDTQLMIQGGLFANYFDIKCKLCQNLLDVLTNDDIFPFQVHSLLNFYFLSDVQM